MAEGPYGESYMWVSEESSAEGFEKALDQQ